MPKAGFPVTSSPTTARGGKPQTMAALSTASSRGMTCGDRSTRSSRTRLRRSCTRAGLPREFEELWLLASSSFLGELRSAMDPTLLATVRIARATDLTSFDLSEIEARLRGLSSEAMASARAAR